MERAQRVFTKAELFHRRQCEKGDEGEEESQVVVALAFALSHVAFGWPWHTIALGVLPSALLFGAAATTSGGLAMPIGLHAAVKIARWAVGETEARGIWTMVVDPAVQARLAIFAPALSLSVTLSAAVALWLWHARTEQVRAP